MSFLFKHPVISSIVLGTYIGFSLLFLIANTMPQKAVSEKLEKSGDVVINVVGEINATYEIDEVMINWEKQIVLVNTNGRAIVYPFNQIQWMNFPEDAMSNPYQLMPAGF